MHGQTFTVRCEGKGPNTIKLSVGRRANSGRCLKMGA